MKTVLSPARHSRRPSDVPPEPLDAWPFVRKASWWVFLVTWRRGTPFLRVTYGLARAAAPAAPLGCRTRPNPSRFAAVRRLPARDRRSPIGRRWCLGRRRKAAALSAWRDV